MYYVFMNFLVWKRLLKIWGQTRGCKTEGAQPQMFCSRWFALIPTQRARPMLVRISSQRGRGRGRWYRPRPMHRLSSGWIAWKGGVYRNRTSCQRTTFWWAYLDSCFYKQRKVSCASKQNSLVNHLSGLCFILSVIIFSQTSVIEMGICLKSWIWTNSYLSKHSVNIYFSK